MLRTIIIILLIFGTIFGIFKYYTKNDVGEYIKFIVKTYDFEILGATYRELVGRIWGAYLCSRNNLEEDGNNKLMDKERYIFIKKIKDGIYEGKIYLTYMKDPQKEYYIICPAAYDLRYIDEMTEVFIDLEDKEATLEIYWAYPPPIERIKSFD
jgi:hypothetical protein